MRGFLRRALVAVGALVAAHLVVWMLGGALFPAVFLGTRGGSELSWPGAGVVVMLGWFVYRDIVHRSARSAP